MLQKNLVIAFGGNSPEHEVSVLTAIQAASALETAGWNLIPLYITKDGIWLTGEHLLDLESYKDIHDAERRGTPCHFEMGDDGMARLAALPGGLFSRTKRHRIDALLCAFHGADGENGAFQGLCETFNIPYTGSDVSSSAIGMDKRLAKELCRQAGIPVVEDVRIQEEEWIREQERLVTACEQLGFPLYVKPVSLGSSIGVHRVGDRQALATAVEESFRYDSGLLVEKAVHPLTEINCSALGDQDAVQVSVCEQPLGKEELLSFEDKYMHGDGGKGMAAASRHIPAPLPEEQTRQIREYTRHIFHQLGCSGVARLDFLLNTDTGEIFFNEINTIPGSFSFYLWEATEVPFDRLLGELISLALKRHQKKNSRVRSHEVNLLSQKAAKGLKGLKGGK
ncbi:D-alanine--D-alanine ligase [Balneolales bacterium ANBcel1]|nr:D-alanine--D-alanine ligase [Balneolales bacterium ANBcel1]